LFFDFNDAFHIAQGADDVDGYLGQLAGQLGQKLYGRKQELAHSVVYRAAQGLGNAAADAQHFDRAGSKGQLGAVVILRKGHGGRFFLRKIHYKQRKFYNWKERILEEVLLSCNLALALKEKLQESIENLNPKPNYQFRYIHADVGEGGATKDMIKEVIGIIRGNGFEPKIKPEAYAASVVADRYA